MKAALNHMVAAGLGLALPLFTFAQTPPAPTPSETRPSQVATPPPEPTAKPAAKPAQPLVTVYGTLNVNGQWTKQQDVSARLAISTDSTNIGFRGGLELRPGISVTYQCETQANLNGFDIRAICGRNSRLGLTGGWGTLFYGNWDTPLKAVAYGTKADDPFMNTDVAAFQGIMGSPGFNYRSSGWVTATGANPSLTAAAPAGSVINGFDVRASTSVAYWTPKWNGLSAKLLYSVNEFESNNGIISPQLYGAAVNYDVGALSVGAAYELHEDAAGLAGINAPSSTPPATGSPAVAARPAFGASAGNVAGRSSSDWAWRVAAGYELPTATTISAMVDQLTFGQDDAPAGAIKEYKRLAWQVALKQRLGDHELRARYSMADKGDCTIQGGGTATTCSTDGYGAQMIAVGYAYHLAKTAQVYVHYTTIMNDDNAQYTFSIGGAPAVAGATGKGKDPQALALGLRYAF